MLLSESDVMTSDFEAILDEAVYLDESEAVTKLPAIPVVENSRLGAAVVSINDLNSIVEDYGCDYEDAFCAIAEQNELDPEDLAVSVEDWKLIETPELGYMVPNIVVKPISEDSDEYALVEGCFEAFLESGDDDYFYPIFGILEGDAEGAASVAADAAEKPGVFSRMKDKMQSGYNYGKGKAMQGYGWVKDNPKKAGAGAAAVVGAGAVAALAHRYMANKNKPGFAAKILAAIKRLASKVTPGSAEHNKLKQLANTIKNNKAATAAAIAGTAAAAGGAYAGRHKIAQAGRWGKGKIKGFMNRGDNAASEQ
nr:hypothetical protein [Catenibacterium mitsuokai]